MCFYERLFVSLNDVQYPFVHPLFHLSLLLCAPTKSKSIHLAISAIYPFLYFLSIYLDL